ncbi:Rax2 [Penicillium italicum]|uniref:Rax2 n=1 Tax=Penicillium italicum TaxID=40296 RepID=A0A0A2L6R3_PENIT|nr:Rax2 [Penicillium italicum]
MRISSLFGPAAAGWPSLLALLPTLSALSFESVSVPELDLTSLGRVSITGDFDGVSLYQYKEQSESIPDGTQALLTPLPNGILTNLSSANAQIMAMCPFTQKDGKFAGIFVGGNFTSLGGVDSPGAAFFNPDTGKVTALPGLSGSVAAVTCDQDTNRVYVGGKFTHGNTTNAVAWAPEDGWTTLPFNGLNGPVSSILKADSGHIIFGGSFDALGNSTSSSNERQILNLQNATVTSDADSSLDGYSDPRNIICSTNGEAAKGKTYLLHDYAPGFWRADLGFDFFPTKIRLYNTHLDGRGTKDFLLRALPDNGIMNLTYIDESGKKASCDSSCPLSSSTGEKYREFTMVNPVGMQGLQIELLSWYGQGAGLNGIEVFQDQILTYAVDQYNEPTCSGIEYPAKSTRTGSWTVESGYVSAKVTDSDASTTSVTFEPDVKKSGNYTIKLYTPGCTQDNSCSSRGIVNVTATLSSGPDSNQPGPSYLYQTNRHDKYDTLYTGYVDANSDSFRPKVTLRAKDGQGDITIVASRVQFELLSSTGGLNGLYDYDPTSKTETSDLTKSDINKAGISLDHNATISIIKEHDGVIYFAGNFSDSNIHHIMSIKDGNVTAMPGSGLNSPVLAMATLENVLYVGGRFTDTSDAGSEGLKHVAAYSYSSKEWSAMGAGLNGPVNSIWPAKLNASTAINETILAVSGDFDQIISFNGNPAVSVAGFAIWVPSRKDWLQNLNVTQMQFGGQLSNVASHNNTLILAGNLATNGIIAGGAVSLLDSDDLQLIPLSMKVNHQKPSTGLITGAYDTDSGRNLTIYGGHFAAAGSNGSTIENVAILNGTNEKISGLPQGVDSNSTFVSMLVYNDTLYAGGNVTGSIGSTTLQGLVVYDLSKNEFSQTQPVFTGSDVSVNAVVNRPGSSDIYFGGNFEGVGQFPCNSVCYVDATTGEWDQPGSSLSGTVIDLHWASEKKLMAVGDLNVGGNNTSIAIYDAKAEIWTAFSGASQSDLPGNVTTFTASSADLSRFWLGGTATNGSAFFLSYDGSNFLSPGDLFSKGTVIRGLELLPARQDHSATALLSNKQTLLIMGSLVIPGFGQASAALYNGTDITPFILSQQANGQPGSMSMFFSEKKNPYTTNSKHHSNGIAVLVAFCCALGCVFLIVLAGVILNKVQRRRQGYAAAPQTFGTDRPSDMQRVPPEYLFNSLHQPNPGAPVL